jgi:hypothetical protein
MVNLSRYDEFSSGKVLLKVPALPDEAKALGGEEFELELIITAKQSKGLQDLTKTYDTLVEIMAASYPKLDPMVRETFIIRHADDIYEQFLLWSGLPPEKLEELKELQKTLIKDYMCATPEERRDFIKNKLNDDANKHR